MDVHRWAAMQESDVGSAIYRAGCDDYDTYRGHSAWPMTLLLTSTRERFMKNMRLASLLMILILTGCGSTGRSVPGDDFAVYQQALHTADAGVVRASLVAIAKESAGYDVILAFIQEQYSTSAGLFATQTLMGYAARPDFIQRIARLLNDIDLLKAGGQDGLNHAGQVRSLLLNQLLRHDPATYGKQYAAALPAYLKGVSYRIGFSDTTVSENLQILTTRNLLTTEEIATLVPVFIACLDAAFHSGEIEETLRCLQVLTGVAPGKLDARRQKAEVKALYVDWLAGNGK